jgi:hypothetical protein
LTVKEDIRFSMPIEIENRTQQAGVILLLIAAGMLISVPIIRIVFNGFPGRETGIWIYVIIIFVLLALGIILREPKEPVNMCIAG